MIINDEVLFNIVRGATVDCIKRHGPIDDRYINSLTKRIVGQLSGYLVNLTKDKISDSIIKELNSKISNLHLAIEKINGKK